MNIKELCEESHKSAKQAGFYQDVEVINEHKDYLSSTAYDVLYDKAVIVSRIALVITELSEAVEAVRGLRYCDCNVDKLEITDIDFVNKFKQCVKDSFEDEIADSFIRLFDLVGFMGIDIEKHIELKMAYNKTRNTRHQKAF